MSSSATRAEIPSPPNRVAVLGFGPMDEVHSELDELIDRANSCRGEQLVQILQDIDLHLVAHFEAEDHWMRQTEFPAKDCHISEHEAVLLSSHAIAQAALAGDLSQSALFIAELQQWFPAHATYLDSALATWLCKKQYGGKPVVLHRRPPHLHI